MTSSNEAPTTAENQSTAELLLEVSNQLAVIDSLEGQLERLIEMTSGATGAARGTLFLNDPQSGELYSLVSRGNLSARSAS